MRGYGYKPYFVEGSEPEAMHQMMAQTLDAVIAEIKQIQDEARNHGDTSRPRWPMIVLRSPKGWTGPKEVDGVPIEGTWRSHQVPLADFADEPGASQAAGTVDEELQAGGALRQERHADPGAARAGAEGRPPHGGQPACQRRRSCSKICDMPDFRDYAVEVPSPGAVEAEATRVLGYFLRDVMKMNLDRRNFRVFGPDETASNRLDAIFEVTDKIWMAEIEPVDEHLSPDGRVMEVLSEHTCQGWLEGYLLTGRHGLFSCYEAFIHIVDSMFNQHAKWLKVVQGNPVAAADRLAELSADVARVAAGP